MAISQKRKKIIKKIIEKGEIPTKEKISKAIGEEKSKKQRKAENIRGILHIIRGALVGLAIGFSVRLIIAVMEAPLHLVVPFTIKFVCAMSILFLSLAFGKYITTLLD